VDAEGAARGGQPVGHALQAGAVGGFRGVEAVAVVGDGEPELPVRAGQGDAGPGGPRVLRNVLQGLADAEVRGGLGFPRVAADAIGLDLDGKRSLAGLRL
jgi:hypothetical protein